MNTNFRIVVNTQVKENYGAHNWDGTGKCPQYWKYKGGHSRVLAESPEKPSPEKVDAIVAEWKPTNNDYYQEYALSVDVLAPGEETHDEKIDREYKEWQDECAVSDYN
jgi:hypothetical protein